MRKRERERRERGAKSREGCGEAGGALLPSSVVGELGEEGGEEEEGGRPEGAAAADPDAPARRPVPAWLLRGLGRGRGADLAAVLTGLVLAVGPGVASVLLVAAAVPVARGFVVDEPLVASVEAVVLAHALVAGLCGVVDGLLAVVVGDDAHLVPVACLFQGGFRLVEPHVLAVVTLVGLLLALEMVRLSLGVVVAVVLRVAVVPLAAGLPGSERSLASGFRALVLVSAPIDDVPAGVVGVVLDRAVLFARSKISSDSGFVVERNSRPLRRKTCSIR